MNTATTTSNPDIINSVGTTPRAGSATEAASELISNPMTGASSDRYERVSSNPVASAAGILFTGGDFSLPSIPAIPTDLSPDTLRGLIESIFGTSEPAVVNAIIDTYASLSPQDLQGLLNGGEDFLSTLLTFAAPVIQLKAREEMSLKFPNGVLAQWSGRQEHYSASGFGPFKFVTEVHSAAKVNATGPLSVTKSGSNSLAVSLPLHAWGRLDGRQDKVRVPAEASGHGTPRVNVAFSVGEDMRPKTTTSISLQWNSSVTLEILGISIGITDKVNEVLRPHIKDLERDIDTKYVPELVDQAETFIKELITTKLSSVIS